MTKETKQFGHWGELTAGEYLIKNGYRLVASNIHSRYGEIDLIVEKDHMLVFVEVKARRTDTFGYPEESVGPVKQARLLASVEKYLQDHPEFEGDWRIDVIAIQKQAGQEAEIVHFENAITEV